MQLLLSPLDVSIEENTNCCALLMMEHNSTMIYRYVRFNYLFSIFLSG